MRSHPAFFSFIFLFASTISALPTSNLTPPIYKLLSPASLETLSAFVNQDHEKPERPDVVPIAFFAYIFMLYFLCSLLRFRVWPMMVGSVKWNSFRSDIQKTMVIYFLQVFITSVALAIQLIAIPLLGLNFTLERVELVKIAASSIAGLYLVELLYREKMRLPMIAHHFLTIFIMSFIVVMLDRTRDPSFVLSGLIWVFQATTEQTTFITLAGYRLKWSPSTVRLLLKISAVQSLVFKLAAIAGSTYVWGKWQSSETSSYGIANSIVIWIVTVGLAFTQFWGSYVVWKIGDTLKERYEKQDKELNVSELYEDASSMSSEEQDEKDET